MVMLAQTRDRSTEPFTIHEENSLADQIRVPEFLAPHSILRVSTSARLSRLCFKQALEPRDPANWLPTRSACRQQTPSREYSLAQKFRAFKWPEVSLRLSRKTTSLSAPNFSGVGALAGKPSRSNATASAFRYVRISRKRSNCVSPLKTFELIGAGLTGPLREANTSRDKDIWLPIRIAWRRTRREFGDDEIASNRAGRPTRQNIQGINGGDTRLDSTAFPRLCRARNLPEEIFESSSLPILCITGRNVCRREASPAENRFPKTQFHAVRAKCCRNSFGQQSCKIEVDTLPEYLRCSSCRARESHLTIASFSIVGLRAALVEHLVCHRYEKGGCLSRRPNAGRPGCFRPGTQLSITVS